MGKFALFFFAAVFGLVGHAAYGFWAGLPPEETAMRWWFMTCGVGLGLHLAWLWERETING